MESVYHHSPELSRIIIAGNFNKVHILHLNLYLIQIILIKNLGLGLNDEETSGEEDRVAAEPFITTSHLFILLCLKFGENIQIFEINMSL